MFLTSMPPSRRNRIALVGVTAVLVMIALWAARGALFPYLFALAAAYILLPAVNRIDRFLAPRLKNGRAARILAIILVYLGAIGIIVLFFRMVVPVILQQFRVLWDSREQLIAGIDRLLSQGLGWYRENLPAAIQTEVDTLVRQLGANFGRAVQTGLTHTIGVVTSTFSFLIGFIVIPFWLFYVLNDESRVMRWALGLIPARWRADAFNLMRITDTTFGAYLRGQLLLCVFIGVIVTLGLMLLGVPFAAVLGLVAGVFEILPFIGPILGLIPAVLVASIQSPLLGLWVLLFFLGVQQVENLFLVPRISGKAVQVHPAAIMVVLVIGNQIAGLWGMLLAVPLTAVLRDAFKYLYLRFQDEPYDPSRALAAVGRTTIDLDI